MSIFKKVFAAVRTTLASQAGADESPIGPKFRYPHLEAAWVQGLAAEAASKAVESDCLALRREVAALRTANTPAAELRARELEAQVTALRASSLWELSRASLANWLGRCETEQDRFILATRGTLVHSTARDLPRSESALCEGDGEDRKKLQAMELRGPNEETGEEPEYADHTYWVDQSGREPVAWREERRVVRDEPNGKLWLVCLIHQPRLVKTGRTIEVLVEEDFECNPRPQQVAELVQEGWLRPVAIWRTDSVSQFSPAELHAASPQQ